MSGEIEQMGLCHVPRNKCLSFAFVSVNNPVFRRHDLEGYNCAVFQQKFLPV